MAILPQWLLGGVVVSPNHVFTCSLPTKTAAALTKHYAKARNS